MKKLTLCCIAATAMLLTSCASTKDVEKEMPVYEGAWEVEEFVKDGVAVTGATANMEIIAPVDGVYTVGGTSGVNSFNGSFNITADTIAPVDPAGVALTKKMGYPEAMEYEQAFLDVLTSGANIALDGDKLVISNETAKITFVEGAPATTPIEEETTEVEEEDAEVIEPAVIEEAPAAEVTEPAAPIEEVPAAEITETATVVEETPAPEATEPATVVEETPAAEVTEPATPVEETTVPEAAETTAPVEEAPAAPVEA